MNILTVFKKIGIIVKENRLLSTEYSGVGYDNNILNSVQDIIYISNKDYINDVEHSFIFINKMPKGKFCNYILISTDLDILNLYSLIQNEIYLTQNHDTSLSSFLRLTINKKGINELVKVASKVINNPIILTSKTYKVIYMYDNDIKFNDEVWNDAMIHGQCSDISIERFELEGVTALVNDNENPVLLTKSVGEKIPRILHKITINNEIVAYLGVLIINYQDIDAQNEVIDSLCDLLTKEFAGTSNYFKMKNQEQKYLLDNILTKKIKDSSYIIQKQEEIKWIIKKHYRLLLLRYEENKSIYNSDYILNQILSKTIQGTFYNGGIILIITYDEEYQNELKKIKELMQSFKLKGVLSSEFDLLVNCLENYGLCFSTFDKLIKTDPDCELFNLDNYIISLFTDYYPFNIYYQRLVNYKEASNQEYIETLITYIEKKNLKETSEALFIHRNTLLHRLDRIKEITNIDFESYNELINFYLFYKTINLKSSKESWDKS